MPSSQASSPSSAAKTKQERVRDNQRRSRARRQEYLVDLERRLRETHSVCRDADLQKTALLDLQRENDYLRNLLMMAGVTSEAVDTFMRQNTTQQDQQRDDLSTSRRQLRPKLHVLPSQPSEPSPTSSVDSRRTFVESSSVDSRRTSVETCAMPSIQPWNSTTSMADTHGLYSESDLCSADAALWSHDNDVFTAAAQADLNQFFNALNSYNQAPTMESSLFICNPTLMPTNGPVFESVEVPYSAPWLRT